MVNELLKIGLSAMSEFTDLRYKLETNLLDAVDKNEVGVDNATANEVLSKGVKASRYFVETRYNLERSLLNSIIESKKDKAPPKEPAPDTPAATQEAEEPAGQVHSGVIQIKVAQKDDVFIPINLANKFEEPQGISVSVGDILNKETGKSVSVTFELEQSKFTIPPNSTAEARLSLAIDGRIFKVGCVYRSTVIIIGFQTRTIDVELHVTEAGTGQTVEFVAAT